MKRKGFTLREWLVTTLFLMGVLIAGAAVSSQAYDVYLVKPPINNYALLVDEPLPSTCQRGETIDLMACRGEYEPASFMVQTDKPLSQVRIHCTPLRNGEVELPPDAVDMRLVQRWSKGLEGVGLVVMPWLLVHDPEMIEVIDEAPEYYQNLTEEDYVSDKMGGIIPDWGKYPDTLEEWKAIHNSKNVLRKPLLDAPTLRPVDIDEREQFWVTVHIPADAQAGTYTATLRIVPADAPIAKLELTVWVPDIDLLPPNEEYSIYYPTYLFEPDMTEDAIGKQVPITDEQMLLEYKNMAAHGCLNPTMYAGPGKRPDGSLDFELLERHLRLRKQAGMPTEGVNLHMFDGGGIHMFMRPMTPEEYQQSVETTRKAVEWAKQLGYGKIHIMGADEQRGEKLTAQRDSWEAIHEGGGGIWVATGGDFRERVGDLLDVAILQPPDSGRADRQQHTVRTRDIFLSPDEHAHWRPESLLVPKWQDMIKGVHDHGYRFFTYMDPWGGWGMPDDHRRNRGFGMWLAGTDGTMTWSYAGIGRHGLVREPGDPHMRAEGLYTRGFILRTKRGVLDGLGWEGYREGYDDSRYIATLEALDGGEWLEAQPVERILRGDLDALRRDLAREILRLQQ